MRPYVTRWGRNTSGVLLEYNVERHRLEDNDNVERHRLEGNDNMERHRLEDNAIAGNKRRIIKKQSSHVQKRRTEK